MARAMLTLCVLLVIAALGEALTAAAFAARGSDSAPLPAAPAPLCALATQRRSPRCSACASALSDEITIRLADDAEVEEVAALQLEVFAPYAEPPKLMPVFEFLFQSSQASARREMRQRLANTLRRRVEKGSKILVATMRDESQSVTDSALEGGFYEEPSEVSILGTVDLSTQEMELPTHGLCDGLYLSHMAVGPTFRRRGLGRRLLQAAIEDAAERQAEGIYLHVERQNTGAIRLYEDAGFKTMPNSAMYATFTLALKLASREPLLMYKKL